MMRLIGYAAIGAVFVIAAIFLRHDLWGWTPSDLSYPASMVSPLKPGDRRFALRDCLPGTIRPWTLADIDEHNGNATTTVLSCRSRSSAVTLLVAYFALVALVLVARPVWRGRIARRASPPLADVEV
jgi:hypothetical protein